MSIRRAVFDGKLLAVGAACLVFASRLGATDGVKPVEFSPVIDANGVVIGWLGEQNAEVMEIDTTERAFRIPLPGGGFTVFTLQEIPGDNMPVDGYTPVSTPGPGRRFSGRTVALRLEVKSGEPLEILLPEGINVSIPAATVVLMEFQVDRLGKQGGALSSTSNRDLYTRRLVTGFVRIETIAGGPVIGLDPGEAPRPIPFGEAVVFDIRNFFLPEFMMPMIEPRLTVVGSVREKNKEPDEPEPATP